MMAHIELKSVCLSSKKIAKARWENRVLFRLHDRRRKESILLQKYCKSSLSCRDKYNRAETALKTEKECSQPNVIFKYGTLGDVSLTRRNVSSKRCDS